VVRLPEANYKVTEVASNDEITSEVLSKKHFFNDLSEFEDYDHILKTRMHPGQISYFKFSKSEAKETQKTD